ncbi:MAG: S8 family serine peptidase [Deltaproteobacteria bacterium]|nr:S8 family serine peptidase [Deltaproteobacteria bacterium]
MYIHFQRNILRSLATAFALVFALSTSASTQAKPKAANPAWAGKTKQDLLKLVHEDIKKKLAKYAKGLDLAKLPSYAKKPESIPWISGKAAEELLKLSSLYLIEDKPALSRDAVLLVRARASNRNLSWAGARNLAEALRRMAGNEQDARQAVRKTFTALPKNQFDGQTLVYRFFKDAAQIESRVDLVKESMVSPDSAQSVLVLKYLLEPMLKYRDFYLKIVDAVHDENEKKPEPKLHSFAHVSLKNKHGKPVRMAIWDLGVQISLFKGKLFTNKKERPDGKDDDKDGQVDDIHGLVADGDAPNTALLYKPKAEILKAFKPYLQGFMDLRAGLVTTQAAKELLAAIQAIKDKQKQKKFRDSLNEVVEWAHGTHCAGLATEGNPYARLAVFRSAWAGEHRVYYERGPTDAELAAEFKNVRDIADFINKKKIRIVSASLGFSKDYVKAELRKETGKYKTEAAVDERAELIQRFRWMYWDYVFRHCPNTVFFIAAGNDNEDVKEYDVVAAGIDAPNMIVVGAVDKYGRWATFTNSNHDLVKVFELGVAAESYLPDGSRLPLSGTSMATPNAAQTAGKMLAVNPRLTPEQIKRILVQTGDKIAKPFYGVIINQKRAIAKARRMRRHRK